MIRSAEPKDCDEYLSLLFIILKDMELSLIQDLGEKKVFELMKQASARPAYRYHPSRGIVCEIAGEIAGIAFGYTHEEEAIIDIPLQQLLEKKGLSADKKLFYEQESLAHEWYLDSLVVSPKYRGKGIASNLLDALPARAKEANKTIIGLNVDQANPKAKKLYQKKGFQTVSQRTLSGHLYDHMQKEMISQSEFSVPTRTT